MNVQLKSVDFDNGNWLTGENVDSIKDVNSEKDNVIQMFEKTLRQTDTVSDNVSNEVKRIMGGKHVFYEMIKSEGSIYRSKAIIELLGKTHNLSEDEVKERFEGLREFPNGNVTFTRKGDAIGIYTVMTVRNGMGGSISEYIYSHAGKLFGKTIS